MYCCECCCFFPPKSKGIFDLNFSLINIYRNLYGYTVIRLYGYTVIRLYGYAVMRLYGYAVMRLCGYAVMRLCGYAVMRLNKKRKEVVLNEMANNIFEEPKALEIGKALILSRSQSEQGLVKSNKDVINAAKKK